MSILSDLGKKYASTATKLNTKYINWAEKAKIRGLKWAGQTEKNFVGFRLSKPAKVAAGVGIAGLTAFSAGRGYVQAGEQQKASVPAQSVGSLPSMQYARTGVRSDLGASGDLVFGLNNMRRGR